MTRKTHQECWWQTLINWNQLESSLVHIKWRCMKFAEVQHLRRKLTPTSIILPQPLKILYRYSVICSILFQMSMSTKKHRPFSVTPAGSFVIYPKWQRRSRQRTWRSKQTNALVDSQASLPPAWCAWHPRSNKSRRPSTSKKAGEKRRGTRDSTRRFPLFFFRGGGGGVSKLTNCFLLNESPNKEIPQIVSSPNFGVPRLIGFLHLSWVLYTPCQQTPPGQHFWNVTG